MAEEKTQKGNSEPPEQPARETTDIPGQTKADGSAALDTPVNELQQKLEAAEKLADSYKDQLLRKAAEFENYKKRTEADYLNFIRNANEGLIGSLIPVVDDFTRSMKSGRETRDDESFFKGIELIYNKFTKLLESHGLVSFDSVGKPFDVGYHDALMLMPRADVPPQTVVQEIERGYKLFEKVIRHAKVIVSAEVESPAQVPSNGESRKEEKN
jgi:molecular chaperone GrpE